MVLLGVPGAVCAERLSRELGRASYTKSLAYKVKVRSGRVYKRQSEELIVAKTPRTT